MDVLDQYIWSKNNFKKKIDEFLIYFILYDVCSEYNHSVRMTMFEVSSTDLDIKYVQK